MIADLLNTLVGLWLTYMAIFPHATGMGRERVALFAAIAMIGLALWARRSGIMPWQSMIVLATGALLAVLMIAHQVVHAKMNFRVTRPEANDIAAYITTLAR